MEKEKNEELEEVKKEEKKKDEFPVIMVLLVLIFMIGIGLGFAACKLIAELPGPKKTVDVEEKEKKDTKKEELDITDSLVVNLFNTFRVDNACWKSIDGYNTKKAARLRLAYENIPKHDKIKCSEVGGVLPNQYCGDVDMLDKEFSDAYLNSWERFGQLIEERVLTDSVKQSDLKAKVVELFGSDYDYADEDFSLEANSIEDATTCDIMHYVSEKKLYARYNAECGGTCAGSEQTINKAYKEGNKLFIETTIKYVDGATSKANYEFEKDFKNGNYIYVKAKEEK